jgi:hypothetical protein
MKAECPGANPTKKFQRSARFAGKIFRAEGHAEGERISPEIVVFAILNRNRKEYDRANSLVHYDVVVRARACGQHGRDIAAHPALAASMSE